MKKIITTTLLIISTLSAFSQQATVIDSKSMTVPRYANLAAITTAITSPQTGMLVYNIGTQSYWFYGSGAWVNLAAAVGGSWALVNTADISNTNSGNVGIGTGSPIAKLDILHTNGTGLSLKSSAGNSLLNIDAQNGDAGLNFQKAGASQWLLRHRPSDDYFEIFEGGGGGSRMVIQDATGNVGIGETTSPAYKLDVLHGGSTGVRIRSSASFSVLDIDANSGDAALRFVKAGVNQWNIRNNPVNDDLQIFELGGGGERMRIENTTGKVVVNGDMGVGGILSPTNFQLTSNAGAGKVFTSDASGNASWQTLTLPAPSQWTTNGSNIHYSTGNVGIGVTTPNAPLQFSSTQANRKLVLYDDNNNNHQFYGFGVNGGALRYQTDAIAADHIFYAGVNSTTSNELFRIKGNGNVGIGVNNPDYSLVTKGRIRIRDSGAGESAGIWLNNNGNTALQTFLGIDVNNNFGIFSAALNTNIFTAKMSDGNIGINTQTPTSKLEVNGTLATKLTKINTFTTVTLDGTAAVWYFNTNPNVTFPSPSTCQNRRYIVVNASGSVINLTGYYVGFDTFQKFDIPINSSIEIISDGSNWLQIK